MKDSTYIYEIRVEGLVDDLWAEWFGGMTITYVNDLDTILVGELRDQTALYGVIERLRDLGLSLISIKRVEGNPIDRPVMDQI